MVQSTDRKKNVNTNPSKKVDLRQKTKGKKSSRYQTPGHKKEGL